MSERKGLLTEKQESFLAGLLDDAINFKNPVLESLDRVAFKTIITVVDNNLINKIPEDWRNPLEPVIDAGINGDWEQAGQLIADLANDKLDLPGLDEVSEQLIFTAIVNLILGLVLGKIESTKTDS